jgi:hypothetical protein
MEEYGVIQPYSIGYIKPKITMMVFLEENPCLVMDMELLPSS